MCGERKDEVEQPDKAGGGGGILAAASKCTSKREGKGEWVGEGVGEIKEGQRKIQLMGDRKVTLLRRGSPPCLRGLIHSSAWQNCVIGGGGGLSTR